MWRNKIISTLEGMSKNNVACYQIQLNVTIIVIINYVHKKW